MKEYWNSCIKWARYWAENNFVSKWADSDEEDPVLDVAIPLVTCMLMVYFGYIIGVAV